jgi:steroid delta-isomerase-like uncharacterized protein
VKRASLIASVVVLVPLTAVAQKKARIAENWIAAWNSHDLQKVLPIFTEDVVYEDVTFGAVNHGSAELRKFATFIFEAVPDLKFELVNSAVEKRRGTIEWVFSGTDKGVYKTGKKFSVRGVSVIDLRGQRISRNLDFYDAASIMRQVGLLTPEKPDRQSNAPDRSDGDQVSKTFGMFRLHLGKRINGFVQLARLDGL